MAVATRTRSGKCTGKTNRPVDDEDAGEGPSAPPDVKSEVKAAGARPEAHMESFSLKDLRGLRKDYTRRPDESIISWLVRLWDAAGEATILDGTEARHLGSLSHDPVINQGMMRGVNPHSLWARVLDSGAQRYLCADDLYMQQTQWKTIEQGIQRLREMAVAEIIFSDDVTTRNPDLVPCTSVMWRKLVQLGPHEYASALAIMKRDERDETVLDMAKKLRAYADVVHGPTHARIAAVETHLQKLEDKIEENHKKLREEIKEDLLQISAVQIRRPSAQYRNSPDEKRRYTPRAELWFFLRDSGENMRRWDGKSTAALARRVRELKEGRTQRGSSTKREAAPVAHSRTARYDDDMSDPLEGTSKTYAQGKKDDQA
ncbi:Friend virus susceptibility protein 1-like [Serinus canaria]|uniref:Friend virus susceptibility protein 1-like n=1 Tax=Serinus canaria TaxID=9135 RepID=UPI0021CD0E99|nr:Friend virus susceptibility protein 1-like [Serinus canaria]